MVPPHGELTVHVRTGTRLADVTLAFDVENALTAPGVHPVAQLRAIVEQSPPNAVAPGG